MALKKGLMWSKNVMVNLIIKDWTPTNQPFLDLFVKANTSESVSYTCGVSESVPEQLIEEDDPWSSLSCIQESRCCLTWASSAGLPY